MGTEHQQQRRSPLSRSRMDGSDDDDGSFVLGLDSESDFSDGESALEDGGLQHEFPPFEPKDPRSKAKYNIFSRLFFL